MRRRGGRPFVVVNLFIYATARVTMQDGSSFVRAWFLCGLRDSAIVLFLTWMTRRKARIGGDRPQPMPSAWVRLWAVAAPVDALVLMMVGTTMAPQRREDGGGVGRFLVVSFLFEVVFDFFHYWTHRLCHATSLGLLRRSHAIHHRTASLAPIAAYEQGLLDVLLCNAAPAAAALALVETLLPVGGHQTTALLWTYKAYVEVAGHVGIHSRATSFPQCVWLPRLLGIALSTEDHDRHHSHHGKGNFSKRFLLWDHLFGTYLAT
mmetsp:Transcript_21629/g.69648  ORF Transcript_21629/g.69648 Transcript_21629/m.69648 type:complete len:263 (-) Transcript_21629:129-917(-)